MINPESKRPILIGGPTYTRLADEGKLNGTFVPRMSERERFPIYRFEDQYLPRIPGRPRKSPRKSPPKAHVKSSRKAHSKSPRKAHAKSPRKSPPKAQVKPGFVVNPETGYLIKIDGPTYARLSRTGKI
jgi:hypothetical protein